MNKVRLRYLTIVLTMAMATARYVQADAPGYEITSTLQGSQLITTTSSEGMIAEHFADPAHPRSMTRQYIVRYLDRSLGGIDLEHRTYFKTNVAAKCETARAMGESGMALFPRGAPQCARQTLDTADLVGDA